MPLVADTWRSRAVLGAAAGAGVVLVLAVVLRGRRSTHVDGRVLAWLHRHVTGVAARVSLDVGTPAISLALLALVLVAALRTRRIRLAVLTVAAPALASGLTEFVLKPWVARPYGARTRVGTSLAFPSGHETLVASAAFVGLLGTTQAALTRAQRIACVVVLAVWTLAAGVGLVVNFWHYTTDVLGAIGLSAAVVLGAALVADRVSSPGARDRPRTSHAA